MRILYFHERASISGSTLSLALSIEALGSRVEPWVAAPRGPAAQLLGQVGRFVPTPSAGLMHIWSGVYSGPRWSVLGAHATALPRHLVAVRRVLREVRPDVVHVNDAPQLPCAWVASGQGFPVVLHLRAALPEQEGARRSALVRRAVARADVAVAINDDVARSYGRPPNVVVLPNPVRVPAVDADAPAGRAREALGLPAERPLVGFAGHFYEAKGWLQLLEAVARLVADGVDVGVVLAGRPLRSSAWHRSARGRLLGALGEREDTEAALDAAIHRLGLEGRAHVLGWRDDMAQVYAALDVVCAPSQGPELSRPLLEAQAHGRAVVGVSRAGGGIVRPEVTGLLVERASPELLAEALRRLIEDPALRRRLGAAARAHAEREYALDVVGDRLSEVYTRARESRALH